MKHKALQKETTKAATEKTMALSGAQTVQERAYELYLKRGQQSGHEMEDWLQAEREIRARQNSHLEH